MMNKYKTRIMITQILKINHFQMNKKKKKIKKIKIIISIIA